jgi:hypothetical protein
VSEALTWICGLIVVYWLLVTSRVLTVLREIRWLHPLSRPVGSVPLSVVIPARNEEHGLAASLRTVLCQEGVDLEVVVVDDHSTDETGRIADAIAREDRRVVVIHDPPLHPGWLGKTNAMREGAAVASRPLLLFSDGDVNHAPTCFATALDVLESEGLDAVSLCPLWENESFWENVDVPFYFVGIARLLALRTEDPASPGAVASGALILVRAEVLERVGGLEAIRSEILDDVALAKLLKRHGCRVGYRLAPECLQVRMFKGWREAWFGPTKNILSAVGGRAWLGLPLIILALVQNWAPILALVLGVAHSQPLVAGAGLVTYLTQYAALFAARRLVAFRAAPALCYPLVALVATANIARAVYYQASGRVHWRGRALRIGAPERG